MRVFDCCPPLCSRQNGIRPGLWLSRPMKNLSKVPRPYYYNDGLLNKMADGPCPATNQQALKDRSGAVNGGE